MGRGEVIVSEHSDDAERAAGAVEATVDRERSHVGAYRMDGDAGMSGGSAQEGQHLRAVTDSDHQIAAVDVEGGAGDVGRPV